MTTKNAPSATVHDLALPEPVARRGITEAQWRTLANNLYPGADVNSVLMVWDYCRARKLDPLKKPCHIVPMRVKDARTGDYSYRDVVMPGIYELRTTAQRTGEYLGHSPPEYGPPIDHASVTAPEWCAMTVYRWHAASGQRIEYPVRAFFREVVATNKDGRANERWCRAPIQMLTKCAEAAALREAFPDEIGGEHVEEELVGQDLYTVRSTAETKPATQAPREKAPAMQAAAQTAQPRVEKPRAELLSDLSAAMDAEGIAASAVCHKFRVDTIEALDDAGLDRAAHWVRTVNSPDG